MLVWKYSYISRACSDERGELYSRLRFGSGERENSFRSCSRGAREPYPRALSWRSTKAEKTETGWSGLGRVFVVIVSGVVVVVASTAAPFVSTKEFQYLQVFVLILSMTLIFYCLYRRRRCLYRLRSFSVSGYHFCLSYNVDDLDLLLSASKAVPFVSVKEFQYIQLAWFCIEGRAFCIDQGIPVSPVSVILS